METNSSPGPNVDMAKVTPWAAPLLSKGVSAFTEPTVEIKNIALHERISSPLLGHCLPRYQTCQRPFTCPGTNPQVSKSLKELEFYY